MSKSVFTRSKIQGIGEPFLHKDFIQMVEYASSRDIWTRSTTNATILHQKNENYKKIIDAGIGELQISVDGTTKESYELIRKGAHFERMIENCKLINSYCSSLGVENENVVFDTKRQCCAVKRFSEVC